MNAVLYEVPSGYGTIVSSLTIPAVMMLFWILLPQIKNRSEAFTGIKTSASKWQPRYALWLLGGIFILLGAYMILRGQLEMYHRIVIPYTNGQYEIVEGYVQNFVPMPREGHSNEMFDINDVHFEYSDNNVIIGYNNARVNGGVVRGNGQYLKVGYIYYNETYGNIIVYIEELAPPSP